jgi:hypothetical protein
MRIRSLLFLSCLSLALAYGCSATETSEFGDGDPTSGTAGNGGNGQGGIGFGGNGQGAGCGITCSPDLHQVLDCNGIVIETCSGTNGCDVTTGTCTNACEAARNNKNSVGCEYYATDMESFSGGNCFAAFVANTWDSPAHLTVDFGGQNLPPGTFARIPQGQGQNVTYQPYDNAAGIQPGEVVILFLAGSQGAPPNCPAPPSMQDQQISGSGIGQSWRIESDVPVVAYQINPYGGGSVAVTGASLLLPTSAWDTNYIGVNASPPDLGTPSMNIIAMEDNTTVTMVPVAAVNGGGGIPSAAANTPFSFTLNRGQHGQLSEALELTGSVISSDKPVGLLGGHPCMRMPVGVAFCDHGEQMIPPVRALGSEYVGVQHRPRAGEPGIWRVIGAVDGTQLSWSSNVGGPATLNQGQIAEFTTAEPFVVTSQDNDHPFLVFAYMAGSQWNMLNDSGGYGDVDYVISVPPDQYMQRYVFFADPTYPETNLVVVRAKDNNGTFHPVNLDCAGELTGWQPVGEYEWTRVDLITGNFQNVGNCSTGRREISTVGGRFGLWVWGWGTPLTTNFTQNVSYGYPGGMNVQPINDVVIPPTPK